MEQAGLVLSVTGLLQQQPIVSQRRLMVVLHLTIFQVLLQPLELGTIMASLQPMAQVKCKSLLLTAGLPAWQIGRDLSIRERLIFV